MYRTVPPRIKIYEALGSLGDKRMEFISPTEAKIFSSSGNKFYTVTYDPQHCAIMMNDNPAYWNGYLGYSGIAYLMMIKILPYNESYAEALKGIPWKDINTQYKNDFDLTQKYVDDLLIQKGIDVDEFSVFVDSVLMAIEKQPFAYLGRKILPPTVLVKPIFSDLYSQANPEQAAILQRFFKTGKGQYGEGDLFLGLKVPVQRMIAKQHLNLDFATLQEMLDSKIHEYRMTALFILVLRNVKADQAMKDQIFDFYVKNTRNINNRDLVDLSAPNIVGNYLLERDKKLLYTFAKSKYLREKRIAIISTFAFLKVGEYTDTFQIAEILLHDTHDLIHKAVGRMLREVGKRSQFEEEKFLKKHYKTMPRTMLRYAIEKFPEELRQAYLKGVV